MTLSITYLLLAVLVTVSLATPVYWLDLEKQLLYSLEDPEMIRYASLVEDKHRQPVYDISAISKRQPEGNVVERRYVPSRAMNLRQLLRTYR